MIKKYILSKDTVTINLFTFGVNKLIFFFIAHDIFVVKATYLSKKKKIILNNIISPLIHHLSIVDVFSKTDGNTTTWKLLRYSFCVIVIV